MTEISKFIKTTLLIFLISTSYLESKILSIGSANAKITVKVFSSLTCPHCATFHNSIFNKLKEEYIDKGLVKFEHHAFPLDLAALNAEIVVRCTANNDEKFKLLEEIYKKQSSWAVGSDINKINTLIKKVGSNFNLSEDKMDACLKDTNVQDIILNERIEAQKRYKIDLPLQYLSMKKYLGKVDYKNQKNNR